MDSRKLSMLIALLLLASAGANPHIAKLKNRLTSRAAALAERNSEEGDGRLELSAEEMRVRSLGVTADDGVKNFCTGGCDQGCTSGCDQAPCFGGCDKGPCFGGCDKCWGACGCDTKCAGGCDTKCTTGCDSGCVLGCDTGCLLDVDSYGKYLIEEAEEIAVDSIDVIIDEVTEFAEEAWEEVSEAAEQFAESLPFADDVVSAANEVYNFAEPIFNDGANWVQTHIFPVVEDVVDFFKDVEITYDDLDYPSSVGFDKSAWLCPHIKTKTARVPVDVTLASLVVSDKLKEAVVGFAVDVLNAVQTGPDLDVDDLDLSGATCNSDFALVVLLGASIGGDVGVIGASGSVAPGIAVGCDGHNIKAGIVLTGGVSLGVTIQAWSAPSADATLDFEMQVITAGWSGLTGYSMGFSRGASGTLAGLNIGGSQNFYTSVPTLDLGCNKETFCEGHKNDCISQSFGALGTLSECVSTSQLCPLVPDAEWWECNNSGICVNDIPTSMYCNDCEWDFLGFGHSISVGLASEPANLAIDFGISVGATFLPVEITI